MPATEAQKERTGKAVHWKDTQEIQQFNPHQPTASQLSQLYGINQTTQNPNVSLVPTPSSTPTFFQPAPPPIPLQAPSFQNTVTAQHVLPFHSSHSQSTSTQGLTQPFPQVLPQQSYRPQSRRVAKQRIARLKRQLDAEYAIPLHQKTYHTLQHCRRNYGFCAITNNPLQKNFNDTLKNNPNYILAQPNNLCTLSKVPTGTRRLLGLSHKYCLSSSQLQNNVRRTIQKMAYTIRMKYHLQ